MKTQDELFKLVKSMDKNEKGYFRKFCKLHGSSREGNYLKLFDTLAAMDEYSEANVVAKFKGEKFVARLSVTRFYLKNLIIRALRNYYEDRVPNVGQLLALADARVMEYKGLAEGLLTRIEKGKAQSREEERFTHYFMWEVLQRNWIGTYAGSSYLDKLKQLEQEHDEVAKKYENEMEYAWLNSTVHMLDLEFGYNFSDEIVEKLKELLQNPLFTKPDTALSVSSKYYRIIILSHLYNHSGQNEKVRPLLRQSIEELGKLKPIKEQLGNNVALIHNLINLLGKQDIEEMGGLVKKSRLLLQASKNQMREINWMSLHFTQVQLEMRWHLYRGDPKSVFPLGELLQSEIETAPRQFRLFEEGILVMEAYALCELRQFGKAIPLVNKLINMEPETHKEEVMDAHWISIMSHIELGNFRILKSLLHSALRHTTRYRKTLPYEKKVAGLFTDLVKLLQTGDKRSVTDKMAVFLSFVETVPCDSMDLVKSWLQWKLRGFKKA